MAERDQTQVVPGEEISLNLSTRSYYNGPLIDADSNPTYIIYDPNNVELTSGTATKEATGIYTMTYLVPSTASYSDYYKIVWTATVDGVSVPDAWEYFKVVSSVSEYTGITIEENWLYQVKAITAYPKLEKVHLTNDEIKQYAIFPALHHYFTKFPKKVTQEISSTDSLSVDFPDSYTFGLLDCRVVDIGTIGNTGSSFWDIIAYQRMGVTGNRKVYGKAGYNPGGLYQQRLVQQQTMKSQQNLLVTVKFNIDHINRKVDIYTSTTGKINLTWAKYSNDFNEVLYQRRFDVIELAQSYLLNHLCDTFGMTSDSNLDVNINISELRSRALDLKDKVFEKWMAFPSVILLKNV